MPMTLYFKRAKSFVEFSDNDKGTRKFLAVPGPHPQPVPFWVASTATFAQGVKDGSIINLTPPEQMPGYKHPKVAVPVVEELPELAAETMETPNALDADEEDLEQQEVPQAPFGAQPMTPVTPAPRVGSVRASTKKVK